MLAIKSQTLQRIFFLLLVLLHTKCIKADISTEADSTWQDTITVPSSPSPTILPGDPNFTFTVPYSHELDLSQFFASLGNLADVSGEVYLTAFSLKIQGNDLSFIKTVDITIESKENHTLPVISLIHYQKDTNAVSPQSSLMLQGQAQENLYSYLSKSPILIKINFTVSVPSPNNTQIKLEAQTHFDIGLTAQKNL